MVTSNEDSFDESDSMLDDDDVGVEEAGIFDGPRRWSWVDTAGIMVGLVSSAFAVAAQAFDALTGQIAAHDAYKRQHVDFASEVLSDVKKL